MLKDFLSTLKNKKVSVIGAGVSNTPLIRMLLGCCELYVHDKKHEEQFDKDFLSELKVHNVQLVLGEHYLDKLEGDVIFRTPGVRPDVPALEDAKKRGALITSEMDVFFSLCPCPITAITGSDGKTTTSTIISELLRAQGFDVFLGGNIGEPLLPRLDLMNEHSRVVVELSSFQLMDMTHSPNVAVITNVTPNHLDWHKGMQEYTNAKYNLLSRQSADNICVLNYDDTTTRDFGQKCAASVKYFSLTEMAQDYSFDGQYIRKDSKAILKADELLIPGIHNVANFMAALAATEHEVNIDSIMHVAHTFLGVEHRIEFTRELDGVKYYNDSIASSPTRAQAGLMCFDCPVVLIAGGYDKKIAFDALGELICKRVDTLMLCGATADKIEAAVKNAKEQKKPKIYRFDDLKSTVEACRKIAKSGSVVLFSPACASFDQFPNFMERGRFFKTVVNELK